MKWIKKHIPYIAWLTAVVSMLGSLYFSEVRGFPPCILCWYQRIAMYPLVAIIAAGIILKDKKLPYYILPLNSPKSSTAIKAILMSSASIPLRLFISTGNRLSACQVLKNSWLKLRKNLSKTGESRPKTALIGGFRSGRLTIKFVFDKILIC